MRAAFLTTLIFAATTAVGASLAQAEDVAVTYSYDGSFDDATFSVESAIIGKGLVIDHVSHTGDILNRTAADVGSETKLFDGADVIIGYRKYPESAMQEVQALLKEIVLETVEE